MYFGILIISSINYVSFDRESIEYIIEISIERKKIIEFNESRALVVD